MCRPGCVTVMTRLGVIVRRAGGCRLPRVPGGTRPCLGDARLLAGTMPGWLGSVAGRWGVDGAVGEVLERPGEHSGIGGSGATQHDRGTRAHLARTHPAGCIGPTRCAAPSPAPSGKPPRAPPVPGPPRGTRGLAAARVSRSAWVRARRRAQLLGASPPARDSGLECLVVPGKLTGCDGLGCLLCPVPSIGAQPWRVGTGSSVGGTIAQRRDRAWSCPPWNKALARIP
jgi:hypothetical protein